MTETVATVKKWGSSAAIILPAALVKQNGLHIGDEVRIDVKPAKAKSAFGLLKGAKIDSQKMKDEIRREENEAHMRKWGVPL